MGTKTLSPVSRSPGGFTLLEVLVAVAIIATALVSLLSLHGRNVEIVAYDQRLNRATLLAQALMTRTLTADPFPDPARASGDFESDPDFHWQVEILPGPTREVEDETREIRLSVFRNAGDADAVRLVTLVRRPDR